MTTQTLDPAVLRLGLRQAQQRLPKLRHRKRLMLKIWCASVKRELSRSIKRKESLPCKS